MVDPAPYSVLKQIEDLAGKGLPPVHSWFPERTLDLDMRITRDGQWWFEGTPIERQRLIRLFSTVLRREADGDYYLVTPVEKCRIQVEDVPFQAILLESEGEGQQQNLVFTTNVGDRVPADAAHPIRFEFDPLTEEPSPYVMVRDGLEARLVRSVYYQLADLCTEACTEESIQENAEQTSQSTRWLGVWSGGEFFRLLEIQPSSGDS